MQSITWCIAVALCIVPMFNTVVSVISAIILNCIERALIVGGSQAVIASL